jgi:predicted secreted protein
MNKKHTLTICVIFGIALFFICPLWAQDTAVFVDLGFSADGRTYMFGQYGVRSNTLRPWAELGVVNVSSNSYVPGGRINYLHDSPIAAGSDGAGALYRVIARNTALADRYNIGYLLQGRLLYVSLENSPGAETAEFRDFDRADSFRAVLTGSGYGSAAGSSFFISLERRNNAGTLRTYTVGNPEIRRPGINFYRIRRVLAGPGSGSLIFVIEMQNADGSADIRYMVETLML